MFLKFKLNIEKVSGILLWIFMYFQMFTYTFNDLGIYYK